jgi:hypothetical protein
MCLFLSLSRILVQGSVSTNLFDPMIIEVDLHILEVGISLVRNIYVVADIFQPGIHFALLVGRCLSFSISFLPLPFAS